MTTTTDHGTSFFLHFKKPGFPAIMLTLGLIFLYLPIFILVLYSFNASRLVTVWAGFSTKWYAELFQDEQLMGAVWTSL